MKVLNYVSEHKTYKDVFEANPELYVDIDVDGINFLLERMPFGKYKDMLFIDLIKHDKGYFNYIKNQIFNEKVSSSLRTYEQRIKMLRVMFSVERYYSIERWEQEYERRKRTAAYC